MPRARTAFLLLVLTSALAHDAAGGEPAADLKSKDWSVRLAAVKGLEASGGKGAEALLIGTLDDKDWEVAEHAAAALGKHGTSAAVAPLVETALNGPIRRVRVTAARSLGRIDGAKAVELLGKRTKGALAHRALLAIASLAADKPSDAALEIIDDALKPAKWHDVIKVGYHDRDAVREAAARALVAVPLTQRVARVETLMRDSDISVAAAAIETVVEVPDTAFVPVLLAGLGSPAINECVERRLRNALRAIVISKPTQADALRAAKPILDGLAASGNPVAIARLVRLVGDLGKAPPPSDEEAGAGNDKPAPDPNAPPKKTAILEAGPVVTALVPAVSNPDAKVRGAALIAMGKVRSDESLIHVIAGASDVDARVRLLSVKTLATVLGATNEKAFKVLTDSLSDADAMVREEAAVALGVKGLKGAIPALTKVVDDACADKKNAKWAIATAALVSMGKTQDPAAVEPLVRFAKEAKDWRTVASAVVGLGRVQHADAIDPLIDALDEKDVCVKACAYEFLRRMVGKDMTADSQKWRAWWKAARPNYVFYDRAEQAKKDRKFGYAETVTGLYSGLDVVVMGSIGGGDHIEDMLSTLTIQHRVILSPRVKQAALHPYALFVANCWGKIGEDDTEALQWFVRSGGYLFASCWSLEETVEKVYPGVVQRFMTRSKGNDVIDTSPAPIAEPCVPDDPFLESVFDEWAEPQYVLEGAYLIEVLDPDRCQILIDSPQAATSWGSGGGMAVWFNAGHGVILDSVNHFSHQDFDFATNPNAPDVRMAYVMDHMGTTYENLRDFAAKKVFNSPQDAEKGVTDESAFRFLSNFVRFDDR